MTQSVGFDPGVHAMQAAGIRVHATAYASGEEGVNQSINLMAQKMREGRLDLRVRRWGEEKLRAAGIDGRGNESVKQRVQVLLDAFRAQTSYASDPVGAEHIQSAVATLCLDPQLCVKMEDCFPEGTLLLRDDHAIVSIDKIRVGDRIWGRNKWTTVQAVVFKGPLSVDALELNNGSKVQLTGDHHVFVMRCVASGAGHPKKKDYGCSCDPNTRSVERVRLRDLKPKDVLMQPERVAFGTQPQDVGVAYVEGLFLSDGWAMDESPHRFHISGKDGFRKEAQKHEVRAICDRLGIRTTWHKRYITVRDTDWTRRVSEFGHYARFKVSPSIALEEKALSELLRGIMADSSAREGDLTFSTTSHTLMVQTRVMHRMFGRSCSVTHLTPEQHGGEGQHDLWRLGVRIPKKKETKLLRVKDIHRDAFVVPCWDIQTEDHFVYLPEHDVTVSNCDGLASALGAVTLSLGIPTRILKQSFGAGQQQHVLIEVEDENGTWLPVDPSTNYPVGQSAYAQHEESFDPMDQNSRTTGTAGHEIVSLGRLPVLEEYVTPCGMSAPPAQPFDQAQADLANQVNGPISAGDVYLGEGKYADAVTAYQAAGQAGAVGVGPEIDLAGAAWITQPLTHQAWVSNGDLQAIKTTGAGAAEATNARTYAYNMSALWQQAINDGIAAVVVGRQRKSTGTGTIVAWTLGLGAVAGVVYVVTRKKSRR